MGTLLTGFATAEPDQPPKGPLSRTIAHAHNDYLHPRPLLDALDRGFGSVEADVFAVDGELLVAHTFLELDRSKTLERLYLKPLRDLAGKRDGQIIQGGPPLILLVDFKSKGPLAWELLQRQLLPYRDLISETRNGEFIERAVTVVVSGDRPVREIIASDLRFGGIDGRLSDISSNAPAFLMPLISEDWTSHFSYRGTGPMPLEQKQKLQEIVTQVHAKGRKLRFWATAESEQLWSELRQAGVDMIGTDDLARLQHFLEP
jgi:hypothetical protein